MAQFVMVLFSIGAIGVSKLSAPHRWQQGQHSPAVTMNTVWTVPDTIAIICNDTRNQVPIRTVLIPAFESYAKDYSASLRILNNFTNDEQFDTWLRHTHSHDSDDSDNSDNVKLEIIYGIEIQAWHRELQSGDTNKCTHFDIRYTLRMSPSDDNLPNTKNSLESEHRYNSNSLSSSGSTAYYSEEFVVLQRWLDNLFAVTLNVDLNNEQQVNEAIESAIYGTNDTSFHMLRDYRYQPFHAKGYKEESFYS